MHANRCIDFKNTQNRVENRNNDNATADSEQASKHAGDTARRQHCDSKNDPFFHCLVPNQRPSKSA